MGLFGASFEDQVKAALEEVRALGLGVQGLDAKIAGKVVTLLGSAPSIEVKTRAMQEFNRRVETENTINQIQLVKPVAVELPGPGGAPAGDEVWHVVVKGETLSALAKQYYGKASMYMKIFEANKDQLTNPDLIKVGQKLRIPK